MVAVKQQSILFCPVLEKKENWFTWKKPTHIKQRFHTGKSQFMEFRFFLGAMLQQYNHTYLVLNTFEHAIQY